MGDAVLRSKKVQKTVQPVTLAEAQRGFDKLVDAQIQKGYRDSQQQPISRHPSFQPVIIATTSNVRH
jgi:predicted DNA-binding WGR domain protein